MFILSFSQRRALLEAMAAGVPLVATAVGGVLEIVTSGKDAILVKKHDGVRMAFAAVGRLRTNSFATVLFQMRARSFRDITRRLF